MSKLFRHVLRFGQKFGAFWHLLSSNTSGNTDFKFLNYRKKIASTDLLCIASQFSCITKIAESHGCNCHLWLELQIIYWVQAYNFESRPVSDRN